jgi:hypothetical protein
MPATPNPELAITLAKATVDVYADASRRLLELVARRLARGITQPGWAEAKLLEVSRLRDEAQRVLDDLVDAGPPAVDAAIRQAFARGQRDAATDLTVGELRAGFGRTSTTAVDLLVTETVTGLQGTHFAILRQALDAYRTVIAEASGLVVTGVDARRRAAQAALDRFAQRGIVGFTDRAGRRWELESYAEMAVRTASGRAQVAGALDRLQQAGRDLVIVSDAPQECPVCRPWEGRVLSITGTSLRYPSVAAATSLGLFHANCRHSLTAWVPGLSRQMGPTADPDGDRARQEQRRLERGIRDWKRRAAASIDPEARRRAEAHVRDWQGRLRGHLADTGLLRQRAREQIGSAR